MDIKTLDIPKAIKGHLLSLRDVELDGCSDKGQNGFVFFGEHSVLKQRVAIKYYFHGAGEHSEVQLVSNIDHPNLLKIQEAHTIDDGYAYFMTREMRFGDLDEYILIRSIGVVEGVNIIRGVLSGIGGLHQPPNYIVHRDLKPENILIDASGKPLIADFGSIKHIAAGQNTVTGSKHAALYRPPEAYKANVYSYSSDLYQVGIVLFQLLGGDLPYESDAWLDLKQKRMLSKMRDQFERSQFVDMVLMKRITSGKLLDMNTLPTYLSPQIKGIIARATHVDFAKRFQTVPDFLHALHSLGQIPNWKVIDDQIHLINWKGRDFRIVSQKSGYICEKKPCGALLWRKDNQMVSKDVDSLIMQIVKTVIA